MTRPATIGSLSSGTLETGALLYNLSVELDWLREDSSATDRMYALTDPAANEFAILPEHGEAAQALLLEIMDELEELAPPNCYFGAHPGDGADFGFWPVEDGE